MAGNDSPRLVKILIRLARNWANTKNRYDRATKRLQSAKALAAKGGNASELGRLDDEVDVRGEAYDTHPFDDFVRQVRQETGFDQAELCNAALLEFNGQREMVTALNALDASGTTAALFANLWEDFPEVASHLFGDDADLAKLLDQANKLFGLAYELGRTFQEDMQSRGPVVMIDDDSPRQRHQEKIDEFVAAVLELRKPMQNVPNGSATVVVLLRKAGQLAKQLANSNEFDILGLFPDLNTVACDGYEAVKVARDAARLDDPFAFLDDAPKPATAETAAPDVTGGATFIERPPAGPEDVELKRPTATAAAAEGGQSGRSGQAETRLEWLAKAMLLVRDHPELSDAEIARRVGKNPSTLSHRPEYQAAARLARGNKTDLKRGYIKADSKSGVSEVEAVATGASWTEDMSDRGQPLPGSKYSREYCAECHEPMKVMPDEVGTNPVCERCQR